MYIVNTDSSIEPINPGGVLSWAFLVKQMGKGVIHEAAAISHRGGPMATNNVGEYQAVLAAMLWLIKLPENERRPVIIQSDSQLVVNQCSDKWNCNDPKLIPFRDMIWEARDKYTKSIKFKWVSRDKNTEADALSRSVYDQEDMAKLREELCSAKAIFGDDDLPF